MKVSRLEVQILLNQICQDVRPLSDAEELLDDDSIADILWPSLALMVHQSHPTKTDIEEAIESAELKPTFTPCVMLLKDQNQAQIHSVASLPREEWRKALKLLIAVFRVSDGKRKARCGSGCQHAWHQDLGDESVLASIRKLGYL